MLDNKMDSNKNPEWEKDLVNRLAFASLNEQKRARRWRIFFQFLIFIYLFVILFILLDKNADISLKQDHVAIVYLEGVIAEGQDASAEKIVKYLRNAFDSEHAKGVIIYANSPGGSPVQAGMIYDEIIKLKAEHEEIPIYTVVSDLCASACYYIAAATDEIYANQASLVGSIGVRLDSFGFVDAMEKLGIERRLLTAGENKALFDPFLPVNPEDKAHLETVLNDIHQQFIQAVKSGRGERLQEHDKLYSGFIWTGAKAKELGLIDDLGTASYVAKELIGEENIVKYRPAKEGLLELLGASIQQELRQISYSMLYENNVQFR